MAEGGFGGVATSERCGCRRTTSSKMRRRVIYATFIAGLVWWGLGGDCVVSAGQTGWRPLKSKPDLVIGPRVVHSSPKKLLLPPSSTFLHSCSLYKAVMDQHSFHQVPYQPVMNADDELIVAGDRWVRGFWAFMVVVSSFEFTSLESWCLEVGWVNGMRNRDLRWARFVATCSVWWLITQWGALCVLPRRLGSTWLTKGEAQQPRKKGSIICVEKEK